MSEMCDLISRETAQAEINKCHITSGVKHQGVWNECVDSISRTIDYIPSADIMEYARAMKSFCWKTDCANCPIFTQCGEAGVRPCDWDLPEGKKGETDAKET